MNINIMIYMLTEKLKPLEYELFTLGIIATQSGSVYVSVAKEVLWIINVACHHLLTQTSIQIEIRHCFTKDFMENSLIDVEEYICDKIIRKLKEQQNEENGKTKDKYKPSIQ